MNGLFKNILSELGQPVTIVIIGLIFLIGFILSLAFNLGEHKSETLYVITVQVSEVGEDGLCSYQRIYKSHSIRLSKNVVELRDATDEFGKEIKQLFLINTPIKIEKEK